MSYKKKVKKPEVIPPEEVVATPPVVEISLTPVGELPLGTVFKYSDERFKVNAQMPSHTQVFLLETISVHVSLNPDVYEPQDIGVAIVDMPRSTKVEIL